MTDRPRGSQRTVDVLQPYDFLMLAVLVLSTLFGAWKGMAWQLAALASVVVSVAVAVHASLPLAPFFKIQQPWDRCAAMLVLYLVTSLGIWLLFRLVAGMIDRVRLKEFDRQVGALFGAAKGVLWCLVITFFVVTLSESARQSVLRSRSGYYTALLIRRARPVLPQDLRDLLGEYIDELDRKLDPAEDVPPSGGSAAADIVSVATGSTQAVASPATPDPGHQPSVDGLLRSRQTETGQTLPTGWIGIRDDVEYFPLMPDFEPARQAAAPKKLAEQRPARR